MAWLRIDDRVRTHPKLVSAGPAAAWFWFCGICYAREHLTDGVIPRGIIQTLAPGVSGGKRLAERLVTCGLWHVHTDGYVIHDFLDWNPSRAAVETIREADRSRKRKGIQTESERSPDGIQTTPYARTGACGLGLGSGVGSDGFSEGGLGETGPEAEAWGVWRAAALTRAGVELRLQPTPLEFGKLSELCRLVPDVGKRHAIIGGFWALDDKEAAQRNVKARTLGYLVMAAPSLLSNVVTVDLEREKFLRAGAR